MCLHCLDWLISLTDVVCVLCRIKLYYDIQFSHLIFVLALMALVLLFADVSGKVRIWDTVNKEHILKFEAQPFAGPIRDLCWDSESKRIAVGGQGREV